MGRKSEKNEGMQDNQIHSSVFTHFHRSSFVKYG